VTEKRPASKPGRKTAARAKPSSAARTSPRRPAAKAARARRSGPRPVAPPKRVGQAAAKPAPAAAALPATRDPGLTEEERIESSKYAVPETRRRVFEEERFLFPETYESDRVRLLVKDPEWLFAHWDVSKGSLRRLRDDVGERTMALSRLTLKVDDPADGALSVVLLPEGARSWYVRTRTDHRSYRAQLGLTMPSGEFRPLATSNIVVTPRPGPSPERASRRVAYARALEGGFLARGEAAAAPVVEDAPAAGRAGQASAVAYIDGGAPQAQPVSSLKDQGGASDVYSPGGASDLYRR
jgi:hypothetical protein